jgi:hypothetical protein
MYFIGLCLIVFFGDNHSPANIISTRESMIFLFILSVVVYVYGAFYSFDKRTYVPRHEMNTH